MERIRDERVNEEQLMLTAKAGMLLECGFLPDEIRYVPKYVNRLKESQDTTGSRVTNDKITSLLKTLSSVMPNELQYKDERLRVIVWFFNTPLMSRNTYSESVERMANIYADVNKYKNLEEAWETTTRYLWSTRRQPTIDEFSFVQKVLTSEMFGIFNNDIKSVLRCVTDTSARTLDILTSSKNGKIFLEGLDKSGFMKVDALKSLPLIIDSDVLARMLHEFWKGDESWSLRVGNASKIFRELNLPFVTREGLERKMIEDIIVQKLGKGSSFAHKNLEAKLVSLPEDSKADVFRRFVSSNKINMHDYVANSGKDGEYNEMLTGSEAARENPLHPFNSLALGIAPKNGFEIEHSIPPHLVGYKHNLQSVLSAFGFGMGLGDMHGKVYEIAPGPFHDPRVAVRVFDIFAANGIVDLYRKRGHTYHFNIEGIGVSDLVTLVRTMQMTGKVLDTSTGFQSRELVINPKSKGYGDYLEAKAFSVMTSHEFRWAHVNATYLAYAAASKSAIYGRSSEWAQSNSYQSMVRNDLANVWMGFVSAFRSAGLYDFLAVRYNSDPSILAVVDQLNRIYSDHSARYGGLGKIEGGLITGATVAERTWPNVAAFAADMTESHSEKVQKILRRVEGDVLKDIKLVEESGSLLRQKKTSAFLEKYGYKIGFFNYGVNMEKIYRQVKELSKNF